MTFYFYEKPIDKEPICHHCGVIMREECVTNMCVTIFRCPVCGDWKEGR